MKKLRRIAALFLVFCMAVALTACGGKTEKKEKTMFETMKEMNTFDEFSFDMDVDIAEEGMGDIALQASGKYSLSAKNATLTAELAMEGETINLGQFYVITDTIYWDFSKLLEYLEIGPEELSAMITMMGVDTSGFESYTCVSLKLFDFFENKEEAVKLTNLFIDSFEKAVNKTNDKMIVLADGTYTMTTGAKDSVALTTNLISALEEDIEPLYDALADYVANIDLAFISELAEPIFALTGMSMDALGLSDLESLISLKDNKEEYLPQVKEALAEAKTELGDALESDTEALIGEQTTKLSLTGKDGNRVCKVESSQTMEDISATSVITLTETTAKSEPLTVTPISTDLMDVIAVLYQIGMMTE